MAKFSAYWDEDGAGNRVLVARKEGRGKIHLDELGDYLRYHAGLHGRFAIVMNTSEETCGASGLFEEQTVTDTVMLYEITRGDVCPICGRRVPE